MWSFWNWRVISWYLFSLQLFFQKKNMLVEFCIFSNQKYFKIIKFLSVHRLKLFTCIERTLKLYPSLKRHFLSQIMEMKNGKQKLTFLDRLIKSFNNEMQEVYLNFLHGQYQSLSNSIYYYNKVIWSFTWCMILYLILW